MNQVNKWQRVSRILKTGATYLLVALLASSVTLAVLLQAQNQKQKQLMELVDRQLANHANVEQVQDETARMMAELMASNSDLQELLSEAESREVMLTEKINELNAAYNEVRAKETQRWVLPIQYIVCTSFYGSRENPAVGATSFHYGVDLAADEGTPVVASRSGTIKATEYEADGAGYYVVIDHLDGYTSRYLHLSRDIVEPGQFVFAGQIIGYCGSTGVSTGAHLHFCIYKDGEPQDPADYIDLY